MKAINLTHDVVPVSEFKAQAADLLRRLAETGQPIVITQNAPRSIGARARRASHAIRRDSAASPVDGIPSPPKNQKSGLVARIPAASHPAASPARSPAWIRCT